MAKLARERRLMERRLDKQAKKEARKRAGASDSAPADDSTPAMADDASQPASDRLLPKQ